MNRFAFALLLAPALTLAQGSATPAAPTEPAKPQPAAAQPAAPSAQPLTVTAAKIGTSVEALEVGGEAASFPAAVGKLFCWTKVTGGAGQAVTHTWYFNGAQTSSVSLPLRFDTVRTYSYKTINPDMKGAWKVEIAGPDGAVLKTVEFQITD
jgi:hypothetical protein